MVLASFIVKSKFIASTPYFWYTPFTNTDKTLSAIPEKINLAVPLVCSPLVIEGGVEPKLPEPETIKI